MEYIISLIFENEHGIEENPEWEESNGLKVKTLKCDHNIIDIIVKETEILDHLDFYNSLNRWIMEKAKVNKLTQVGIANPDKFTSTKITSRIEDGIKNYIHGDKRDSVRLLSDYYTSLEENLQRINRYIMFHESNFLSFGIENFNQLYQTCNIFEIISKMLLSDKDSNMTDWRQYYNSNSISERKVNFKPIGNELQPLNKFRDDKSPEWWNGYNKSKHNIFNIKQATLENCINSLGAVGIALNDYQMGINVGQSLEESKLFTNIRVPVFK